MSTCCTWPFRVVLVVWPVHAFINTFYMHVTYFSLSSSLCHSPVLLQFSFMWACRTSSFIFSEKQSCGIWEKKVIMNAQAHTRHCCEHLKIPHTTYFHHSNGCMHVLGVCAHYIVYWPGLHIKSVRNKLVILKCIFPTPALFFKWIHPDILVWM